MACVAALYGCLQMGRAQLPSFGVEYSGQVGQMGPTAGYKLICGWWRPTTLSCRPHTTGCPAQLEPGPAASSTPAQMPSRCPGPQAQTLGCAPTGEGCTILQGVRPSSQPNAAQVAMNAAQYNGSYACGMCLGFQGTGGGSGLNPVSTTSPTYAIGELWSELQLVFYAQPQSSMQSVSRALHLSETGVVLCSE